MKTELISTEAVHAAAERFYSALNRLFAGELRLMKEAWSHEDDRTSHRHASFSAEVVAALENALLTAQRGRRSGGKCQSKHVGRRRAGWVEGADASRRTTGAANCHLLSVRRF